jgi:hypothetical protein
MSFKFYPSAYYPRTLSPIGVWVKHKPFEDKPVRVIYDDKKWIQIECPDRHLLMVRNSLTPSPARPLDLGYDEFVSLSLTNAASSDSHTRNYMVNYAQHAPRFDIAAGIRKPAYGRRDGLNASSDAGGFQIFTGKESFIDPTKVAAWYNDNVDEGLTLDIPVLMAGKKLARRSAQVQNMNTKLIQRDLRPDFRLFDVSHGQTDDAIKRFRSIASRDIETDYLCVGGVYITSILKSVDLMLYYMLENEGAIYKQYHALGIYNVALSLPLIRAAALINQNIRPLVMSSDASTPTYAANQRMLIYQRAHWRNSERMPIGSFAPLSKYSNHHRILPCGCTFCQAVKYVDVAGSIGSCLVAHALTSHNQYESCRWFDMMSKYAYELTDDEYLELSNLQLENSFAAQTTRTALRYVRVAVEEGLSVARTKFKSALDTMFGTDYSIEESSMSHGFTLPEDRPLTEDDGNSDPDATDEGSGEGLRATPDVSEVAYRARMRSVMTTYEEFHAARADFVTPKRKGKSGKRLAKKIIHSTSVKRAGDVKRKPAEGLTSTDSTHLKNEKTKHHDLRKKRET